MTKRRSLNLSPVHYVVQGCAETGGCLANGTGVLAGYAMVVCAAFSADRDVGLRDERQSMSIHAQDWFWFWFWLLVIVRKDRVSWRTAVGMMDQTGCQPSLRPTSLISGVMPTIYVCFDSRSFFFFLIHSTAISQPSSDHYFTIFSFVFFFFFFSSFFLLYSYYCSDQSHHAIVFFTLL